MRSYRLAGALLALATLIALGLWLKGFLPRPEDPSWQKVSERGILRVGLDPSFPPFEALGPGGELAGYDVDLAKELARRLGLEVGFVATGFDGLTEGLLAGRYDCLISSFARDPALTRDLGYSRPYFNAGFILVLPASTTSTDASRFLGPTLGAERGSEGELIARKLLLQGSGGALYLYTRPQQVLEAVSRREVAGGVVDSVSAQEALLAGQPLRMASPALSQEQFVIAVRAKDRVLLVKIDGVLAQFQAEGRLGQLEGFAAE